MSTRWRGRSLSYAKPAAWAPISNGPAGNVDPALGDAAVARRCGRVAAGQVGEKQRLAHRLVVLRLVADDHLEERAVARAGLVEHLERAGADRVEVVEDVGAAQERDLAARGARRLEGVVEVGEVAAQQVAAAVAMDEPEVLVGGDVAEIPVQRAHQRVLHALEILVREAGDQRKRAIAGVLQGLSEGWLGHGRHRRVSVPGAQSANHCEPQSWRAGAP